MISVADDMYIFMYMCIVYTYSSIFICMFICAVYCMRCAVCGNPGSRLDFLLICVYITHVYVQRAMCGDCGCRLGAAGCKSGGRRPSELKPAQRHHQPEERVQCPVCSVRG